ncbi:MAG: hypothetical protein E7207_05190 [Clostridium butyricum]|nr:hypothetical protein [Clostridium butyricum]
MKKIIGKRKVKKIKNSYKLLRKKEMLKLAKSTYSNIRYNFKAVICFEMCYKILVSFLFIPINYFIVNKFMKVEGIFALTNKEFLKFATTPVGVISTMVLMLISFLVIFIEISVLTYVAHKSHKGEKVTLIEGIFNSFSVIPRTLGFSMVPLFLIIVVIGPLIGVGFCSSLIRKLTIPPFVTLELYKTMEGKIAYGIFIFVILILLFRWVLAIPELIIENKKAKECLKNSKKFYRRNKLTLFVYMSIWTFINTSIFQVLATVFNIQETFFGKLLGRQSGNFLIVGAILLIVFYELYVLVAITMMPIFISFLVELFYRIRGNNVEERKFATGDDYSTNLLYKFSKKLGGAYLQISIIVFVTFIGIKGVDIIWNRTIPVDTQITAHRGSTRIAPENSISAIREAISEKADFAEIDVQTTKDNIPVLFHDINLKRIDGTNREIKNLDYEQVSKVDNGSYFNKEFAGEKIPTLESVLQEAKGKIKLNIELKPMKKNDTVAKETLYLIEKYNMENQVVITCMDYDVLQEAKAYNPLIKYGYIIVMSVGEINSIDADFISIESSLVKHGLVSKLHNMNKEIHVWTINDEDTAEEMMSLGVDNIITDNVGLVKKQKEVMEWGERDYLQFYLESILNVMKYSRI